MVPTDEAMITRQMLYSALLVPATCAAFAIPSSICLLNFSAAPLHYFRAISYSDSSPGQKLNFVRRRAPGSGLRLLQASRHIHCRIRRYRKLAFPLGEPWHGNGDDVRPSTNADFGWRVAHVLAVQGDFRTGGRRTEIAPYLFRNFFRRDLPHPARGRRWRGSRGILRRCRRAGLGDYSSGGLRNCNRAGLGGYSSAGLRR